MNNILTNLIDSLYGVNSKEVVDLLYKEGLLDYNTTRNYLIRKEFDSRLRQNDHTLIKHVFTDLSIEYDISVRQAQRIVYDHMNKKMTTKGVEVK